MIESLSPRIIKYLSDKYHIKLTKSLGQNLLMDRNVAEKIAEHATMDCGDKQILEIGPGFGSLTLPLSRRSAHVTAVEIDSHLVPLLEEALADTENVELVNADFLKFDLSQMTAPWMICGNLPYNITTPIIMKILEQNNLPERMTFMVQKEVADRIAAGPGGKERGAVSVLVQYMCKVERVMEVSRNVFYPKPEVDSSVIVLRPGDRSEIATGTPESADYKFFKKVVRASFSQRRKMIKTPLLGVLPDKEKILMALADAGVPDTARAETLTIKQFINLSAEIKKKLV